MNKYRFGFALTTALGNKTRYSNFKKYADRDPEVECIWAPLNHWIQPNPYRRLPGAVQQHFILQKEADAVLKQWDTLDAVMIHAFQLFAYCSLKPRRDSRPLLIWNQDYAPFKTVEMLRAYGQNVRDDWKRRLRYKTEKWFTRRADLYIPWSDWAGDMLIQECGVPRNQVEAIHIGADLEVWPYIPPPEDRPGRRLQILFVGGDFERKGGPLLLRTFAQSFADRADLHLVTKSAPPSLPPHVFVYDNLKPNEGQLQKLYAEADVFALPTSADMSSIVAIEAMATGRPVVSTRVGGIPDIVSENETGFLIDPGDERGLTQALTTLLNDSALRHRMGVAARRRAETDFNAEVSVARLLSRLKSAVEHSRAARK